MTAAASNISALLLAGWRPTPDPLAVAAGVAAKPLAPVAGEAMISYPAREPCWRIRRLGGWSC
jgi:hypothetical protein